MVQIDIYTRPLCPFCVRALKLLDHKDVAYREIDAYKDAHMKQEMVERAGGAYTYPQIFIDDHHIGGCDDLYATEAKGDLDKLLKGDMS